MCGKIRGNAYRNTMICIDSYEGRIPRGRFYNVSQPQGVCFSGLVDFLLKMEGMLDNMDFPQSFSSMRSFTASPIHPGGDPAGGMLQAGELATFELRLLFRQNTSWQGCLTWLEGDREESFRSVLELTLLIDSALIPTSVTA